jgi:hypothetical protein
MAIAASGVHAVDQMLLTGLRKLLATAIAKFSAMNIYQPGQLGHAPSFSFNLASQNQEN